MLTGRTDGEMQPDDTVRAVFEEELIEVLISVVGDVDQNAGITVELFFARDADIDRAPRQMIRGRYPTRQFVHRR